MGKKTGNAVKRNRLKRLVREFFRCSRDEIGPGLDVVVVPKRGIDVDSLGLCDVVSDLLPLLRKAARNAKKPPRCNE